MCDFILFLNNEIRAIFELEYMCSVFTFVQYTFTHGYRELQPAHVGVILCKLVLRTLKVTCFRLEVQKHFVLRLLNLTKLDAQNARNRNHVI